MELKTYFEFLRRRWWLVLPGPVLAALAAFFVTQQITPIYQATATVLVNRATVPGVIEYNDILTSERLTNTYAQLVTRPQVLEEVKLRLNLPIETRDLEAMLSVVALKDTQLIQISASDADPALAAALVNTTAQAFSDDNAGQTTKPGTVSLVKPADVPRTPVSPNLMFNLAFAFVLGALLAVGLGLLLDYLDDTIKDAEDVEATAGLPLLGAIGRFRAKSGPAFATEMQSRTAEAYRQLRTNVHFTTLGADLKTIVITSASPEEGKSTTASNLATVLAQAGDKVILVDTDLRRSSLNKTFDGPKSIGLTGLLLNDVQDPAFALIGTRWKNLQLLPTGVLPPNPSELLTSARMQRVMTALREMADYVIFDTPPVLAVTDAIVLAARTDGTIVVAEAGKTRSESLRSVARSLQQANARPIGVVLNKAKVSNKGGYYYRDDSVGGAVEIEPDESPVNAAAPEREEGAVLREAVTYLDQHSRGLAAASSEVQRPVYAAPPPSNGHSNGNGHTNGNGHSNGNGHANGNGHTNGNGNGHEPQVVPANGQPVPLSDAMTDLLAHFDDTLGLIRSLKPGSKERDA